MLKKNIVFIIFLYCIIYQGVAQCSFTAIPGSCTTTFSSAPTGTYGNGGTHYYCYSPASSTPVSVGTITVGQSSYPGHLIINSPADLTIATLNLDGTWGGLIYIASGAKLTITNALSITGASGNLGVINYGTLIFNGAVTVSGGSVQTASSTAQSTFNSTSTFNGAAGTSYRSKGTTTSVGLVTLSAVGVYNACLDNNSFWSVGAMTIGNTTQIQTTAGGTSIINYSGVISLFNNTGYTANTVKFCNNGGSGSCAAGVNVVCSASACANPNVLPVFFGNISAQSNGNGIGINWVTLQEYNNDYFEVERSYDGVNFQSIEKIEGQGTKTSATTYMYFDEEVNVSKTVYYRLKQIDFDSKFDNSPIIVVSPNDSEKGIAVYPNPVEYDGVVFNIKFQTVESGDRAMVSLVDASGKEIQNYKIENIQTGGIYVVKDGDLKLPRGVYFIKVKTLNQIYNSKLIVK